MKKTAISLFLLSLSAFTFAQTTTPATADLTKPETTEVWDPQPVVVTPAAEHFWSQPPSDAIVLFGDKNRSFSSWKGTSGIVAWTIDKEGFFTVKPGTGDITTKQNFGSCQLHIEWRSPDEPADKTGQGRGNSGIFFQDRYEVQVLNSYQSKTYANGQAGSVYKQHVPLVNATEAQGKWNAYDIVFEAPKFRKNGTVEKPAYITVFHNGILVQNHVEVQGPTEYIGTPTYKLHGDAPIHLQDHSNMVSYRNIWIRPL